MRSFIAHSMKQPCPRGYSPGHVHVPAPSAVRRKPPPAAATTPNVRKVMRMCAAFIALVLQPPAAAALIDTAARTWFPSTQQGGRTFHLVSVLPGAVSGRPGGPVRFCPLLVFGGEGRRQRQDEKGSRQGVGRSRDRVGGKYAGRVRVGCGLRWGCAEGCAVWFCVCGGGGHSPACQDAGKRRVHAHASHTRTSLTFNHSIAHGHTPSNGAGATSASPGRSAAPPLAGLGA